MLLNRFYKKGAKKRIHTILRLSPGSLICLALMISGCAMVGPDYVKPTVVEPEKWLEAEDPQIKSETADFSQWWTVFNDPGIVLRSTGRPTPAAVMKNRMARRIYESLNGERTVAEILLHAHASEFLVTKFLFELRSERPQREILYSPARRPPEM